MTTLDNHQPSTNPATPSSHIPPLDAPDDLDANPWADARAGAREEAQAQKASRRQSRIDNCGKPRDWYNKLENEWQVLHMFCHDWTCDFCNRGRASDEQAQLEYAIVKHDRVYGLFDIPDKHWPKLRKLFKTLGITTDSYRRLPQDRPRLTVFFTCQSVRPIVAEFPDVKLMRTADEPDDSTNGDLMTGWTWFDLARKRPGRRTSGTLGKQEKSTDGDDEHKTSVKIVAVRGQNVTSEHRMEAMKLAEETVPEDPQDHEHLEELIARCADAYEGELQRQGYKTHRATTYRKLDLTGLGNPKSSLTPDSLEPDVESNLTAIHQEKSIAVKPSSYWQAAAVEALYPRQTVEI